MRGVFVRGWGRHLGPGLLESVYERALLGIREALGRGFSRRHGGHGGGVFDAWGFRTGLRKALGAGAA